MIQELKAWAQALSLVLYCVAVAMVAGAICGVFFFALFTVAGMAPH